MKTIYFLITLTLFVGAQHARADLNIFACEPEWASLATELGGEKVSVSSATTGMQDPHQVQARPSLITSVRNADMIACTGAELEIGWLPLLLRRVSNTDLQQGKAGYFMATDYVQLLEAPRQIDRSQGDVHSAGNPHIQTSPANILPVARAMSARFVELDAANSAFYTAKMDDFELRWKQAMARWKTMTQPLRKSAIVVHHASWIYLEDWLKLNRVATLETKPGIPPTSGHLANILHSMEAKPADVIIRAAYQSDKATSWLTEKTGIPSVALPFTVGGSPEATDLFSLFDETFKTLLAAKAS